MEWVNYHHLLYFWLVAREGSLARASTELRLAQSTVSKQIHQFEDVLGHKLFAKMGRQLVLTESGQVVFRYADEIFGLGREMLDTLRDRPVGKPLRVTVGIADVVPKLVAERVLAPALALPEPVRLVCREDASDRLLAELALHELDVILTDAPANPNVKVRAFSHLLGQSEIGPGEQVPQGISCLAHRGARAAADRGHHTAQVHRPVARCEQRASRRHRRVRGQRPAQSLRHARRRRVSRADGRRQGG